MIQTDQLNCGTGSLGTWFDGCKTTPKDWIKAFMLSPAANINLLTDTFDETARATLIKNGQLIALNEVLQVNEVGAKNNYQTFPNKKKLYISQGLYEFTFDFEANPCLVKSLHALTRKRWQLMLLDSDGKLFFDNNGGHMKGFEIQVLSVDNETVNDGGSKIAMVTLTAQLSNDGTFGYNNRRSFVVGDDYYDINGVQDVKVSTVVTTAANFTVQVVGGCDGTTPILGLTKPNFKVANATTGAPLTITTCTDLGGGEYKLTGVAIVAGDATVQLWDSVLNTQVADVEQVQFFQSNKLAVTLT